MFTNIDFDGFLMFTLRTALADYKSIITWLNDSHSD